MKTFITFIILLSTPLLHSQGTIIALHGTGSAGKSSISKILLAKLPNAIAVSVDDFIWPVLLENSLEKKYIKKQMSKKEQEEIVMRNIEKLSIKTDQMATLLQKLYEYTKTLSNEYAYVLLDTVFLRYQDYQWFCDATKDIPTLSVLVYCSPIKIAEHVIKRNGAANHKEWRGIASHIKNFAALYQKNFDETTTIDTLTEKEFQKTLHIIHAYLIKSGTRKSKIKQQLTKLQSRYFTKFFNKNNEVAIKYEFSYDIMVNTGELSSLQCAELIYEKLLEQKN